MTDDYAFGELPLAPVPAGTTMLVTGPGRPASRLARRLVLADPGDPAVVVSTDTAGGRLAEDCLALAPDFPPERLGLVDATGSRDDGTDTGVRVETVSGTRDLTGISIRFSVLYAALVGEGSGRLRTCFDSVSTMLLYADFRTITRFVHAIGGRVNATDGFGVFVLDPEMHDRQVVRTLGQLCDGQVDVRRTEDRTGHEVDVQAPGDQPRGWQPLDL